MTDTIILAELTGYDPDTSAEITWRFATGDGYDNAGLWYAEPRIENPATFARSINGVMGGRASVSYGELTLVNPDRALDAMGEDYFDGRELVLKLGPALGEYDRFMPILRAQIESIAIERSRVSVRLRDRSVTLDTPFSSLKYAGTNALPNGIEGTADDLKDQPKPILYGRVALMSPVMVNTSKLIYQVHAGPITALVNVFDAGAYLDRIAEPYADQADMEANAPSAGSFRAWPAGGCFRLGAKPYGAVSCCVAESLTPERISAAGLLKRILTASAANRPETRQPSGGWDWHWQDLKRLDAQNAGSLGLVVGPEETTASLLDRICQSVGAVWGIDAMGALRVVRLDAPSGTPVVTLDIDNIINIDKAPDGQAPLWGVTLKADGNYAVQDKKSLAGVVTEARVAWFAKASRDQTATDAAIKAQRLLATEQTFDTLLNGISSAQAEAARRVALWSETRSWWTLTLCHPLQWLNVIDIGTVINVSAGWYGGPGKLMTVTSVQMDFAQSTFDLICFG